MLSSYGSSSTWLYYVDESYDASKFCLSAIGLKSSTWKAAFDSVKAYRTQIKQTDGIYIRKEIHATKFVAGRGKISPNTVSKWRRARIFHDILQLIASLPDVHLFNVCLDVSGRRDPQLDAWDRLLNRVNTRCEKIAIRENSSRRSLLQKVEGVVSQTDYNSVERRLIPYSSHAIVIGDEGRELEITKLRRKLSVFNPVPSQYGSWGTSTTKNMPLTNFVEDTLFKNSEQSFLIQLADCAAFALLKREVPPTSNIAKYDIHKAWDKYLAGVCWKQASTSDAYGIVRK